MRAIKLSMAVLLLLLATLPAVAQHGSPSASLGAGYDLTWSVIAGGGGTANGGAYQLSGTVGHPDAGVLSGGGYTLNGGFWGDVGALQHVYLPIVLRQKRRRIKQDGIMDVSVVFSSYGTSGLDFLSLHATHSFAPNGEHKRRSDGIRSALPPVHPVVLAHNELAGSNNCLPFAGTTDNISAPAEKITDDFKCQPETRSTQTPHPVWFYI
jgi:hypothetical protein